MTSPTGTDSPTAFAAGRYRIGRFLGEGAKKRVYLAHDQRLGRDVVVALIKTTDLDESQRARVESEARAMGRLGEHPHAVNIYDVGDENGQLYVVAQYVAGADLEQTLNSAPERRLPIDRAVTIAGDVCDALADAHAKGVIHRDVKPGNIYVGDDGNVKLGDFGLAVAFDRTRITQEGMLVGTPSYMAPELALGRAAEARSDLYALGATLYEMVVGRPPFVGDDAVAIISQHINTRPVAPGWHRDDVPAALEALILQLLEKDLDARPATAKDVRKALADVLETAASPTAPAVAAHKPLEGLASSVFVGRESELANLHAALEQSLSGHGQLRMLVGEPGAGKTRTAAELTTYAGLRDAQVLWGRCFEGEGAPPYWPWRQIIRNYVQASDTQTMASEMGPGAADIAELVSDVRERLPGLPLPEKLEANLARFRLWDSISTFLRNASTRQPLVLVVDDLHRADEPSLLLLQFLASEIGRHRIMLLGTYRDVELRRHHPLSAVLAQLSRERLFERILLRGLARQDVARFIEGATGTAPAPGLADAVYRETEGNPFFTHEVVRLLAQEGRLGRAEGETTWSHAIPQGVREVVGHRLDALSEGCNTLMATASAFGREFDLHVLARVSELSEDAALEHIEEALAAQLLAELPESIGRYQFSHALVQQTLYEEHSTARRVRLHRRVGEALEALYANRLEPQLAALAYHFGEAAPGGDVAKAVDYAERAARQAAETLAHEEAVLHYQRALQAVDLLQPDDPERRCALLLDLADAQFEAGDAVSSAANARAAADVARRIADGMFFGRAAITMRRAAGFDNFLGETRDQSWLEEALERLPDDALALRAEILSSLAWGQAFETDERADANSLQAVALARKSGDTRAIVNTLNGRWAILMTPGHSLAERVAVVEELTQHDPNWEVTRDGQHPSTRFHLALAQGKGAEAQAALDDMARRAAELRSEPALLSVRALRGQLALLRGDFAGCEQAIKTILRTRDPSPGFGQRLGLAAGIIYGVHRERGTLAEIEHQLDVNIERINETAQPVFRASRMLLYIDLGRLADARSELEAAVEAGYFNARIPNWLMTLGFLGEACARVGDKAQAAALYASSEPYARTNIQLGASVWTPVSRVLGLLAATLGRHEEADRYFTAALDMCERLQSPPLRARTELDFAEVLHARGNADDRERIRKLVRSSLDIAEELGMNGLVERGLTLKLDSDGLLSTTATSSIESVGSLVAEQRPNFGDIAAADGTVTLLFSDIEDYTGLLDRLGDVAAHQLVSEHNAIVRQTASAHEGREVELRGDGFLLAFADPDWALRCAIALQQAFAVRNVSADTPIRIRIGLHTGETIRDADTFFGGSVVAAFRVADLAAGGEILVSQAMHDAVDVAEFSFDAGRDVALKGFDAQERVFTVRWQ